MSTSMTTHPACQHLHLLAFALSLGYYSQLVLKKSTTRIAPYKDPEVAHGYKAALHRLYPLITYDLQLHSKKVEDLVYVHSNSRLATHKDNVYKKGETKHWDVEPERAELEDLIACLDALAVDDDDHELPSDAEASPKADIASTNASGTFCASNLQQQNDDDLFHGF